MHKVSSRIQLKRSSLLLTSLILISCSRTPISTTPENTNEQSSLSSVSSSSSQDDPSPSLEPSNLSLPRSVSPLAVPFSPQAPFANWDPLHEESCEEMSLIMVHHFLAGTPLSREQAEQEIQDLVKWEAENGFPQDVTVVELGEIAEKYYGHQSRVVENPTIEDLKAILAEGHPIIVPAAGRDLGNPYFTGEGPWYHMLVLTGYGWWNFITNDPGTRRGEEYEYRFQTLLQAIHDWTGIKEQIRDGSKRVLIIGR